MRWHSQSINLATESGILYGELILPKAVEPFPGAVLCHGMGTDHRAMRPCAQRLARQGIATLTFDFRGHGRSEGFFDGNEAKDVIAALNFLRSHPKIDPGRIALVGHSMGAMAAIRAAAELKNLRALVSLSSPSEMNGRAERFLFSLYHKAARIGSFIFEYPRHGPMPGLGKFEGIISTLWMWLRGYRLRINWKKSMELWGKLGLSTALERLGAFPKLFVHCQGDKLTPYQGTLELYEKAGLPKELLVSKGGFHAFPLFPGKLRRKWIAWLVSVLR